jgi:hypothetical protein
VSRQVRRQLRSALALAATAIVGGVVHANAPPGQYSPFDRSARCISDQFTKLTWARTPGQGSFDEAAGYCASLGADSGATTWRLPTVNELETLVDENPHFELEAGQLVQIAIDANAFPATPATTTYWTSSPFGGTSVWGVYFEDGTTTPVPKSEPSHPFRCVTQWTTAPAACPL